ncbi:hypothetical protein [Streptomyces sp. NPDC002133]|uniref:hypothetical protein n=1 Tax=Streptomyces sp. NPDC002133 TaxID=3154409 RepID=UPI003324145B
MQRSTSTLKRGKANVHLTAIVAALGLDRKALVINCLGIRAAESPARSKKLPLSIDTRTSNGKRLVLTTRFSPCPTARSGRRSPPRASSTTGPTTP